MAEETKNTEELKKAEKKPKKNPFRNKKFKHGALSVVFTVIFVAAIVLVNVILNLLLDRFDVEVDLTEGGIYSMGQEMEEFISDSQSSVKFYFTSDEETMEAADPIYKQTMELVKKATNLNSKYEMEHIDLLMNPAFAEKYAEIGQGGLLIECAETGRYKFFDIGNEFKRYTMSDGKSYSANEAGMYQYYYGYTVTDETSIAEQELLSGLMSITKVNPVKIGVTEGFGEIDNAGFTSLLEKNAYVIEKINVEQLESVPEEYDIILINAPSLDYTNDALNKLDAWLSNGGLYGKNLFYIASVTNPVSTPNLDGFLAEWGLSVGMGYVCQLDTNYAYSVQGYAMPLYQSAEIVKDTAYYELMQLKPDTSFRVNGVRPVNKLWEEQSNYINTTVLQTYGEDCVVMPFDAAQDWTPEAAEQKGSFSLLVESSKVRYDGTTPYYSRVVAAGSEMMFDEYFLTATNYNNAEVGLALFNTVSGNTSESITIAPKSFTATTYVIDASQQAGIGITFAIVIPVIIIVTGIVVWVRRKRL